MATEVFEDESNIAQDARQRAFFTPISGILGLAWVVVAVVLGLINRVELWVLPLLALIAIGQVVSVFATLTIVNRYFEKMDN